MSSRTILFTTEADQDYIALIARVLNKWGQKSARKLDQKIKAAEKQIIQYPEMHPQSDQSAAMRKCVVTPQTTLYYTIQPQQIVVVAVFDNRQNPAILGRRK